MKLAALAREEVARLRELFPTVDAAAKRLAREKEPSVVEAIDAGIALGLTGDGDRAGRMLARYMTWFESDEEREWRIGTTECSTTEPGRSRRSSTTRSASANQSPATYRAPALYSDSPASILWRSSKPAGRSFDRRRTRPAARTRTSAVVPVPSSGHRIDVGGRGDERIVDGGATAEGVEQRLDPARRDRNVVASGRYKHRCLVLDERSRHVVKGAP